MGIWGQQVLCTWRCELGAQGLFGQTQHGVCGFLSDLGRARSVPLAPASAVFGFAHANWAEGDIAYGCGYRFGCAGRGSCGCPRWSWRCSGVLFRGDRFGDDQSATAAWAWQREDAVWFTSIVVAVIVGVFMLRRPGPEQAPDAGDVGRAVAVSVEAVVADAVLAFGQDVDQEPSDELGCVQRHGGVSFRAIQAVVLHLEGHAGRVEADQSAI